MMKAYLLCGVVIAGSVIANLLLKLGSGAPRDERILGLLGSQSIAGLLVFGVAGLVYAVLLRYIPLNLAQSLLSLQYVGVIFAAFLVLDEPISPARWLGIGLIATGVLVVVRSS